MLSNCLYTAPPGCTRNRFVRCVDVRCWSTLKNTSFKLMEFTAGHSETTQVSLRGNNVAYVSKFRQARGLTWIPQWTFWRQKRRRIPWTAEGLTAYQKLLCSAQLANLKLRKTIQDINRLLCSPRSKRLTVWLHKCFNRDLLFSLLPCFTYGGQDCSHSFCFPQNLFGRYRWSRCLGYLY